jgi:hypothetical protein
MHLYAVKNLALVQFELPIDIDIDTTGLSVKKTISTKPSHEVPKQSLMTMLMMALMGDSSDAAVYRWIRALAPHRSYVIESITEYLRLATLADSLGQNQDHSECVVALVDRYAETGHPISAIIDEFWHIDDLSLDK